MENADALIAELESTYNIPRAAKAYFGSLRGMEGDLEAKAKGEIVMYKGHPYNLWRYWEYLEREVHELLCKKSEKYKHEREALKHTIAPAVAILGSALTTKYGIGAGAASSMAAIALLIPLKLTINAWCAASKPQKGLSPIPEETRKVLEQLAEKGKNEQVGRFYELPSTKELIERVNKREIE